MPDTPNQVSYTELPTVHVQVHKVVEAVIIANWDILQ